MSDPDLRLLDAVSWKGRPVTGERSHALLAVLAAAGGRSVGEADLADAVWGEHERPAQPGKALQVIVSRTRAQTGRDVVVRVERGYRLGPGIDGVDASAQARSWDRARRAEGSGDLAAARSLAREVLDVPVAAPGDGPVPLEELRAAARGRRVLAAAVAGRAAGAAGDHAEALTLLLGVPDPDEATLAALLRAEAAAHGAPRALTRYERHREAIRDDLGVDPGPLLQAVHAELLAADSPVRTGLLFDTTSLVGRDDDLRALRTLVRQARVVSILGPGGLGKTRLAHLLGRGAEQPVVHFVELVGVAAPEDVVGEVGSALGVRDSVSGRRVLTPGQRADVRGRIAQQLDQAPTLLILDNCEHVVEAVADLVAFLVATAPRLRVVTTTRAPLAIAAERVFGLGQLPEDDGVDLFVQRAAAARPGVRLDPAAVRRVVRRLDGLPLAIELAAARVRAMSVDDIDRRLDDRFALLRGVDRSAPDRHRTLLAVIDWSWVLLGPAEQRGLARLALFHDGFALDAAEAVLGPDALGVVEELVGQSLLTVREDGRGAGAVRYRMLETVREFARLRLGDDEEAARAAGRAWAVETCRRALDELYGERQVEVVRALTTEENNLADALREALAEPTPGDVVVLLAAVGGAWTIRGEHSRVIAMTAAVDTSLDGWEPTAELIDITVRATGVMVMNTSVAEIAPPLIGRALFDAYGAQAGDPRVRALHLVLSALEPGDPLRSGPVLEALVEHPDRYVRMLALQWASHARENAGDVDGAVAAGLTALALWEPADGVWSQAQLRTQVVGLYAQLGRLREAASLADVGIAVLDELEAWDDSIQLRAVVAGAAVTEGRLDEAERLLDETTTLPQTGAWGAGIATTAIRAELLLARGQVTAGLALYDRSVEAVGAMRIPGLRIRAGFEPWTLYAESSTVSAHARFGTAPSGRGQHDALAAKISDALDGQGGRLDYPVLGGVMFALGAWRLRRCPDPTDVAMGIELLALAERFRYSRYAPSMAWEWALGAAETALPGALPAALAAYDGQRGPDLLGRAREVVARL